MEIPKIIHQIWIGTNKQPSMWIDTWRKEYIQKYPDWKYILWTEKDIDKFDLINKTFYDKEKTLYGKSDILRYEILYKFGGVYIDADSVWINGKNLENLRKKAIDTGIFAGYEPSKDLVANGVIGCSKGNDIMNQVISEIPNKFHLRDKLEPWQVFGPSLITKIFKNKATIFPSIYFYPRQWHNINDIFLHKKIKLPKESYMFQYGYSTNNLSQKINDYLNSIQKGGNNYNLYYKKYIKYKSKYLKLKKLQYGGQNINYCIFTNDNNQRILLPTHPFSDKLKTRDKHEVLFRKINTYLILNNIIKANIIDLGAWIGDNSIPWAKNIGGIIYAIDPSKENCSFIKEVCNLNNIKNIKIIQKAIGDKNEKISTDNSLDHATFKTGIAGKNVINSYTLDYLYEQKEIDNIGYIHLDVEGMEFKVVLGAEKVINIFKPIVTFEQHLDIDNYKELVKHFKNQNYIVYMIDEILPGNRPDCRNFIAFPKEKFSESIIQNIHNYLNVNCLTLM